ncbi:MAG TPA: DegT/DnrJ/EryC1/StrS family aminotransferase [Candidatus Acidoferrales bacterium]|nr:DegT/DnrJ/EryC1/StrS family aminotransferase [Candidatus Acidoferrales bacterium]
MSIGFEVKTGKLAVEGGTPVRTEALPLEPEISDEEIDAVVDVMRSKRLSQLAGKYVEDFEIEFARYVGTKYAVAVNSGTSALSLAVAACQIGTGDEIILPPYTFVATANGILQQNAIPIFADVDKDTFNLDPRKLETRISDKTRAIMPVHMMGYPCDMDAIMEIARKHDLMVIEDSAQAAGAEYKGRKAGSIGDVGCFSFYMNKNMTSAEGGMLVTNDHTIAERAMTFRNHCRPEVSNVPNVPAYNIFTGIGWNFRMNSLQAVIGRSQLRRLDDANRRRSMNAEFIRHHMKPFEWLKPQAVLKDTKPVYWFQAFRITESAKIDRDEFTNAVSAEGVKAEGYTPIPVHLQELFTKQVGYGRTHCPFDCPVYGKKIQYKARDCPEAERLCQEDVIIPCYHALRGSDLNDVVTALTKIATHYQTKT